ncbi:MAG: hypothetical protein RLY49_265 [Candidatus Parcubacteria bacterium]
MEYMWKTCKMKCDSIYILMKKLTPKQRKEVVTKGFLFDNKYLTLKTLDEIMDPKNRVTREQVEEKLSLLSDDLRQHLEALMEHQMHQLQVLMEQMDERYVLRREWNMAK